MPTFIRRGAHSAPTITSLVAADANNPFSPSPGLSVGDTLTINFNIATNAPAVSNAAEIAAFLTFSASLGTAMTGTWSGDAKQLKITVTDITGNAGAASTRVGTFKVTAANGVLVSADQSSPASTAQVCPHTTTKAHTVD